MRRSSFATHWRNWHQLRAELSGPADPDGLHAEGWTSIRLLDRPAANRLQRVDIPHR